MTATAQDWALRHTQRLVLRAVTLEDAAAVAPITTDPRTNLHRPGGPPTAQENARLVGVYAHDWAEHGIGYWVIEREGAVIGIGGVKLVDYRGRTSWNVYYRLAPEAWGQGLALEAVREAVAVADRLGPEKPLLVRTSADNAGAIRLAERLGLQRRADLDEDDLIVLALRWD